LSKVKNHLIRPSRVALLRRRCGALHLLSPVLATIPTI
jgi:hypothetical protein